MRDYQPAGVLVASVNGNYTYGNTASSDLLHSNEVEVRSPMSTDSHFSLLTAASSTLSIVSQSQHCDWPEFQESYNSIMDNTNLLDSCAAALNDITGEEKMLKFGAEKVRCEFNRSLSSTTNSSFSGVDSPISLKSVQQFTRWLCDMENRVAAQPNLCSIVAMKPKKMASQLEVHSQIFKEISSQPCIVKGTKRSEYKLLEERYHLLYLKVYEVLLLLDGLPANSFSPSNRILGESLHDFECNSSTNSKEHSSDHVDNSDNEFLHDVIYDKTDSELKTPIYTETSVLSTSIGTYYFNYDDSIDQLTDNANKLSSTVLENSDKEFTFEHDLHSLLDATDSLCLKSQDHTLVSEHRPLQQQLTEETVVVSQKNHIWNRIDFCELVPVAQPTADSHLTKDIEFARHKVYDWLHSKADSCKSKSTQSLDYSAVATGEADYQTQILYRAKSEMDLNQLSAFRSMDSKLHRASSLRTSLNYLPSVLSPVKRFEAQLNDSILEESSLIWDNFQLSDDYMKPDSDFGLAGSDFETKELINDLCYFGDDYSLHLNESITGESENVMSEPEREPEPKRLSKPRRLSKPGKNAEEKPVTKIFETPPTSPTGSVKLRRSRRLRDKRLKSSSSVPSSDVSSSSETNSTLSLDQISITEEHLSEASTASVTSDLLSSTVIEDSNNVANDDTGEFVPEKTISYNSDEKQFELHTKESAEPKKMKINEMQPEDFHDIVKMCQSNIDCVITVLGADPNRILTVAYCQQMKFERYQKSNTEACKCKEGANDASKPMNSQRTKDTECNCSDACVETNPNEMCICAWVSHTIAMILNFLIDCWNVFRNMKLYTYLCRVTKALFGSTRYVADHLKSKRALANIKAIKYS